MPLGAPLPASTPQALALGPSQRHLLDEVDEPDKEIPPDHPQTLTIILACRSGSKAEISRKAIIKRHEKELARRERKGIPVREGWREGLELIWEGVDFDSVGGSNGILTLCERLKEKSVR